MQLGRISELQRSPRLKKIFNFSGNTCRIIDVLSCPGLLSHFDFPSLLVMEPRLTGNYQQLTTTLSSLLPPPMDFKHIFHDAATLNTVNSRLFPSRNLFLFRPPPHPNPHPTPNFPITFMRRTLPETIFRLNCNSWNS